MGGLTGFPRLLGFSARRAAESRHGSQDPGPAIRRQSKGLLVNVTVENLAPCKKLMKVELDAQEVDTAFESMIKEFQRSAELPGFRPGKAPRHMIVRRYEKDIQDEVKKKLIPDSYRKAVKDKNLDVLGSPDIEEIQFGKGQPLQFAATFETAPDFELPDYKGLPATRETAQVADADVEKAITLLRERQVTFETATRPAANGDIAVVNYTGTSGGKPITEIAPTAKGLTEQKNFWVNIEPKSFIPGFTDQLIGAKAGDKRTVNVDFPADFVTPQLANQKGVYEVEIVEIKEKILPAVDDAFAKEYGAENLEKLRAGVRTDLENELTHKQNRSIRNQLVEELLKRVNFDLPESAVASETRSMVYDIVHENQKRGIGRDLIEKEKDSIYSAASQSARVRVKSSFLFQKIAEKEGIKVSQQDVLERIQTLAAINQVPPEKFIKDLQQRNGVVEIYDQLANVKVLDFLQQNATITDVPAKDAPAA
jgi:trigger factor